MLFRFSSENWNRNKDVFEKKVSKSKATVYQQILLIQPVLKGDDNSLLLTNDVTGNNLLLYCLLNQIRTNLNLEGKESVTYSYLNGLSYLTFTD